MNLIEFLREKLTPTVEQKISSFLGEPQSNVNRAVHSALPTILGGLIQQGTTEEGAKKVMDIIKDGGHTGDVLNNISGLLDNYDKSQLLVTIGSNIFNHFFGNTAAILTDKVANLSEIKNSSASSLLGLMSPLVLGAIGYVVNKENLGITGLKQLLNDQREDVSKALPPLIAPHLPLRSITPATEPISAVNIPVEEEKIKTIIEKKKNTEKSFINTFLPWLFLIILAILSAYYLRSCRVSPGTNDTKAEAIDDFSVTNKPITILDDSSAIIEERLNNTTYASSNEETSSSDLENNGVTNNTPANTTSSEKVVPVEKSNSSAASRPQSSSSNSPKLSSQRLRNTGSWLSVSSGSFKSNSAELQNPSEINTLAAYLSQNPNSTISIAPAGRGRVAEDRAYAIREQLHQKGIAVSRIFIEPARNNGNEVSVKVNR